jgi:hypothetical protein
MSRGLGLSSSIGEERGDVALKNVTHLYYVKRSFLAARSEAALNNLRFHDLQYGNNSTRRRTYSLSKVGRLLGHT